MQENRSESENMSPAALAGASWFAKSAESQVFGWCRILNSNTGSRIFCSTLPVEVQLDRLLHHTK